MESMKTWKPLQKTLKQKISKTRNNIIKKKDKMLL